VKLKCSEFSKEIAKLKCGEKNSVLQYYALCNTTAVILQTSASLKRFTRQSEILICPSLLFFLVCCSSVCRLMVNKDIISQRNCVDCWSTVLTHKMLPVQRHTELSLSVTDLDEQVKMQLAAAVPLITEAPISSSLTCDITHTTAMTVSVTYPSDSEERTRHVCLARVSRFCGCVFCIVPRINVTATANTTATATTMCVDVYDSSNTTAQRQNARNQLLTYDVGS